jgi:hypothetical protein
MQVSTPSLQHEVMIEGVENHNPEVIVIDEIGRELEALAARTIAERGVQLVGTAHGNTLENLLVNPTLSDLVGGIESVTLSDEEARRRGTQKTVLERRSPPTFDVLIEIQTRDRFAIHHDVGDAVDSLLRGNPIPAEIRSRDAAGQIQIEHAPTPRPTAARDPQGLRRPNNGNAYEVRIPNANTAPAFAESYENQPETPPRRNKLSAVRVYPYGVARNRMAQAAKKLGVPAVIAREVTEADVLVTLRSYYRKRQHAIVDAEHRGMPIYVLRANTINQMEQFLSELFNIALNEGTDENDEGVMQTTRAAINAVLNGENWVELPPASSYTRRLQHEMARQARLVSHSYGKEPYRRVRIFREQAR